MNLKSKSLKWTGIFSTALLNTAVLSPNTFNIPFQVRPWLFIFDIFWIVSICSGIFTP